MSGESSLPPRELGQFRQLVRYYEAKQYKKGLKQADQILKKYPKHGDTLSMKALIMSFMPDKPKSEAYAVAKEGLKANLKGAVSWHVLGLLHRGDRENLEALKCYRTALKNEDDNQTVLKDLSSLQVHLRELDGYRDTKNKLLKYKGHNSQNWLGYAISEHLLGNHDITLTVLDAYATLFRKDSFLNKFEANEVSFAS